MKNGLLIMLLCVSGFLWSQETQHADAWISVKGNQFVNDGGNPVIFHGLNASDPDKLDMDGKWNQEYFGQLKSWGANLVRFPVHPRAWNKRGPEAYMDLLDKGIELAKANGLYVVIDWHSIGNLRSELYQAEMYNTTKRETFEFWRTIAKRYGNSPTVAFFELFNEPTTYQGQLGTCSWAQWKEIVEEMIVIIRAHGAKNIPLVSGFNWAYDLTAAGADPIDAEGIAYVSHPYPQKRQKPWELQWEKDWGFMADKYPLILTEIGFCGEDERGAHIPVISDESYGDAMTTYCAKKGISYCVWVFDPQWSPMLIENWDYTPTRQGRYWKDVLSKY